MAMDKLDLLVVIDPYPSATAAMAAMPKAADAKYELNPNRAVYLLPAATQFETEGSVTASNRSIQWREKVIEPLFESRSDHAIMYHLAQKLGFADQFLGKKDGKQRLRLDKTAKGYEEPNIEDVLTYEINGGSWTIGYTGQSPRRLQAHMRNMHVFDVKRCPAPGQGRQDRLRPDRRLLRPAVAVLRQRGAEASRLAEPLPDLAERHGRRRELPRELRRRARRRKPARGGRVGVEGADLQFGYPEFDHVLLKKLGWWDELTEAEEGSRGQELEDRSVGRHPARGAEELQLPPLG